MMILIMFQNCKRLILKCEIYHPLLLLFLYYQCYFRDAQILYGLKPKEKYKQKRKRPPTEDQCSDVNNESSVISSRRSYALNKARVCNFLFFSNYESSHTLFLGQI